MMKTKRRITVWHLAAVTILASAGWSAPALAQSSLDASEAAEYIGVWNVSMEFGDMTLTFRDVEGKLGATLESDQQPGPTEIQNISKSDEGLNLEFDSGGFGILTILVNIEGGGLVGTLASVDGAFSIELTGIKAEFGEGEIAEGGELTEEQRRALARRRRGPATSKADYDGKNVQVQINSVPTEGPDFEALSGLAPGTIVRYTVSSPVKMSTDADLAFGDVVIEKENVAKDYPGVYSVWLKKLEDGWSFVFNNKPDVWGTQHDPETDAAEVPAAYETADEPTEKLEATITKDGENGTLKFAWGTHVWTAQFKAINL